PEGKDPYVGMTITRSFKGDNYKSQTKINFKDLTALEVEQLRYVMNTTLDRAHELAEAKDTLAKENYDNGGDPEPRLYRTVARLYEAQQQQQPDDSELQE
ncbi:MAG: hypothetical protein KJN71_09475, partial [Acidimicrobiia bacterium]|nr:hypothetical protein [Acidimicrobiia bacterium]